MAPSAESASLLVRYQAYTRRQVHAIFSPHTPYTPQAGVWGLQGIVSLKETGDTIFFVTYGQKQGTHTFQEAITEDGVLTWQSQPTQKLHHPAIQRLIHHNETRHHIHLFLRGDKRQSSYFYLGTLAYLWHDPTREDPVFFRWQIQDWSPPPDLIASLALPATDRSAPPVSTIQLEQIEPPAGVARSASSAPTFLPHRRQQVDFTQRQQQNQALGDWGEDLMAAWERQQLTDAGLSDLASQVRVLRHTDNTAPFDILSFFPDGRPKYIEVKTTTGGPQTPFYLSARELSFCQEHPDSYLLYRVCRVNRALGKAQWMVFHSLTAQCTFTPTQYQVHLSLPES
jgi:hypothetical protein